MMVQLQSNCLEDLHYHNHCLQWTGMEDELKSSLSAKSAKSTLIQLKVTRTQHESAFCAMMMNLTGWELI